MPPAPREPGTSASAGPLLYGELASWFHLLAPPEDRHVQGLFPRATWRRLLAETGFDERAPPPGPVVDSVGEVFLVAHRR